MKWWHRLRTLLTIESPSLIVVGRLSAAGLALLTAPIVARILGPSGRGETAAAIALYVIIPVILALGLPLEVRRQAAAGDGQAVLRTARRIVGSTFAVSIALAVAASFTIFATFPLPDRVAASVGVILAPLAAHWALDVGLLVAQRKYRAVLAMQLIQPLVYLILVLVFWATGVASVATVLGANIMGSVATFVLGMAMARVPWRGPVLSFAEVLKAGLRYFGSAIAEASSSKLDQVIALPLLGAYQAGIYSVAATIASFPLAIGQALGATFFPTIAQASAGTMRKTEQAKAARVGIAAAIVCYPPLALCAWALVPLVFGDSFAPAVGPSVIALLGSAFMIAAYVMSMALAADGKGVRMSVAQAVALCVGVLLLLSIGPVLGAVGAAVASVASAISLFIVLLAALRIGVRAVVPRKADFADVFRRLARD